jgi:hypothetical protein
VAPKVLGLLFQNLTTRTDDDDDDDDSISSSLKHLLVEEWGPVFPVGQEPPFDVVLLPSYHDRAPFFRLITCGLCTSMLLQQLEQKKYECIADDTDHNNTSCTLALLVEVRLAMQQANQHWTDGSAQALAKHYFDDQIGTLFLSSAGASIVTPHKLLTNATERMSIMSCMVLQDINLAQLFLWIQEKTLFGMGRLLFNPSPGVDFSSTALVRNLLLAPTLEVPSAQERDEFYQTYWAVPLEDGPHGRLDDTSLLAYVETYHEKIPNNSCHVSAVETSLLEMAQTLPRSFRSLITPTKGILLYARFVSRVEAMELLRQQPCGVASFTTSNLTIETCKTILEELAAFLVQRANARPKATLQ